MALQETNASRKQQILGALATSQAMLGDFDKALRSAEALSGPGAQDAAFMRITSEMARQGDTNSARALAARISEKEWTDSVLQQYAYTLGSAGDSVNAVAAIDRIQQPGERAASLAQLSLIQAQKSDPATVQTLSLAQEAAQSLSSTDHPFIPGYISVAKGYIGDFSGALQIVSTLDDNERMWPLWSLTELMVDAGKKGEALALAHAQKGPLPRAYALLGTASQVIEQVEAADKKAAAAR
jgi:hypothetical protein